MSESPWKEIGVLTRDNALGGAGVRCADRPRDPGRDRRSQGAAPAARGRRGGGDAGAGPGRHRQRRAADAAGRVRGGRSGRATWRCSALASGALAGQQGQQSFADLETQLAAAVEGADPLEIPSLCDALEDPGDLDYSPEARERFALLADELRLLRRSIGEPILDLVRRIIDVNGIDVELASSVSPAAAARRENLDLFVQAVADFQAVDGQVTLPALLAWLDAEDEFGQGLDVATPSEADSVKLLTVHRAKGLEWDAVFLVGRGQGQVPRQPRSLVVAEEPGGDAGGAARRRAWTCRSSPATAPTTSPTSRSGASEHEQVEELRLAYVAWTRPATSSRCRAGAGPRT